MSNGEIDWGWGYYHGLHHQRPNMLNEWRRYCAEHLYRFIHELFQEMVMDFRETVRLFS